MTAAVVLWPVLRRSYNRRSSLVGNYNYTMDTAKKLESSFPDYSDRFAVPTFKSLGISDKSDKCLYFCGNSLGLMPLSTEQAVLNEIKAWKERGVVSHFNHPYGPSWVRIDEPLSKYLAPIVGAQDPSEVAVMNTLTGNLHTLFSAFYKPTATRYKVLYEDKAFPSDNYALQGQVALHGYKPEDALIRLKPRDGEYFLREEDILSTIEKEGDSIALVIFSGIQYYTGQWFDMKTITEAARAKGCVVGWDLAHAVGNVPLHLHDWDVDFAVFCTYKYLNSGPGAIGGIFVHSRHATDNRPRMAGWWGVNAEKRFNMESTFDAAPGAAGYKMSNPTVLSTVCLGESLKLFDEAGSVATLRKKSVSMTNYLQSLLESSKYYVPLTQVASTSPEQLKGKFTIITPLEEGRRGAQLSLLFYGGIMYRVFEYMSQHGVVADERKPDVIRLAPNPLYNTHPQVYELVQILNNALSQ